MRIAISGKGGSGKTTLAGTLARVLAQRGLDVLAIDGDPNPTLGQTLGIPYDEVDALPTLPADLLETVAAPDGTQTRLNRYGMRRPRLTWVPNWPRPASPRSSTPCRTTSSLSSRSRRGFTRSPPC